MPKIQNNAVIDVTPEKFLNACDSTELQEVELLLSKPFYQHKTGRRGWRPQNWNTLSLGNESLSEDGNENMRIKILSSKGYWEEADLRPEFITERIKEAFDLGLQEAAKKAKTKKTGNSGSWMDASVDENSILSLQINNQ